MEEENRGEGEQFEQMGQRNKFNERVLWNVGEKTLNHEIYR